MAWLYATLARGHDPRLLALAFLAAAAVSYAVQHALQLHAKATGWPRRAWPLAAAAALGFGTWLSYVLTVHDFFPHLDATGDWATNAQAIALVTGGALLALVVSLRTHAGYRDLLLAGAVLAAATACSVFLSLSCLTRPYRLAYELAPVFATVLLSALLGGLGFAEAARPRGLLPRIQGVVCLAAAQIVPIVAGLASILSFSDWLAETDKPASLATEPVMVVLGACGMVILLLGAVGSVVDHHLALRAERESERLRQLADSAMEGLLIHRDGRVLDANAAFCILLDAPLDLVRGRVAAELFTFPVGQRAPWDADSTETVCERQEISISTSEGDVIPVEVLSRNITYKNEPAQVLAVRDIRERRAAEDRIQHLAHHDGLTGLPNRVLLRQRFSHALKLAERSLEPVAVLCLDLDRFKAVNDTMGHAAGDLLLCQVAQRLRDAVRETDTVARMGGDEFVVLQPNGPQPQTANDVAARLIKALCTPFDLGGQEASIGTSIGIALYPRDGSSAEELLTNADVALYRAKTQGRGTACQYEPSMNEKLRERQLLERDLRAAIDTDQLALHYQPLMVCNGDNDVSGFEALMRWSHPARGAVSPVTFIPLAEETGLIVPLGRWALETACRDAVTWPRPYRVAVNLSPVQFRNKNLPATVAEVLKLTGLAPHRLELEVTEGLLIGNTEQALAALRGLKALGVRIALDDFGTGYSSLSYLHRFPFDKLKIDKSFVRALEEDKGARAIVEAIMALSRSLSLDVTAEGVETYQQLAFLQAHACGTVQGFLFGRPMPAEKVFDFLRQLAVPSEVV